jgi:uncharacterized membrane protein YccF (DUF307 family)
MQSIQEHRDDGEGREQDRAPSFPQPTYPAGMAGQQQFLRQPSQGQPPVVVQNYYQAPPIATPVMVEVRSSGPSFLARALWFIFVGWWLGLIWLHIGYALCVTGIFLPVGLLMLNRLPAVLTLRSSREQTTVVMYGNGMTMVRTREPQQVDFLLRAVYFLLVGWWLGYVWALVGYVLCFTIVLMPIGILMLNRLPTALTLRRV